MIRLIKPDAILTTHHPDENHGHDLALLRVLPQAVRMARDAAERLPGTTAHDVSRVFRTATEAEADEVSISLFMDEWDADRGRTFRHSAYRALAEHQSQRPFQEMAELFQDGPRTGADREY